MRVAFASAQRLRPDALESGPLGGSESSLLLVARQLAREGTKVYVVCEGALPGLDAAGIEWLPLDALRERRLPPLEVLVSLNRLLPEEAIPRAPGRARYLHWHQNDVRSPYGKHFAEPAFVGHVDGFVFVSHTQAEAFRRGCALEAARVHVVPNPVAAPFSAPGAAAAWPGTRDLHRLVYASAPNRGLEVLIKLVWPRLRAARPALRLDVFSGFTIGGGWGYAGADGRSNTAFFEELLASCARTPGVELHRGVRKAELAAALRQAAMLCYPCIYRETCCIVALEAMAAGCRVSTSDCGALSETTAGFAQVTHLPEAPHWPSFGEAFAANTLAALEEAERDPAAHAARIAQQVEHVRARHSPAAVAAEWRRMLAPHSRS
jgi:glycosyltransferase involved in cell wall biosynthesis